MGVAAYNRVSACLSNQLDAEGRSHLSMLIDDLNAYPKKPGAGTPFQTVRIVSGHGGWWAECPTTGFGYWHRNLWQLMSLWRIAITSVDATAKTVVFMAEPIKAGRP